MWQGGFIYSPCHRGRGVARAGAAGGGVALRAGRGRSWVAGPAAWRSRGFVRPGRGSSVMLDRDERSTSASRAPRWAGPGRASCDVALPRLGWLAFVPFGLGWARRATRQGAASFLRLRNCGRPAVASPPDENDDDEIAAR